MKPISDLSSFVAALVLGDYSVRFVQPATSSLAPDAVDLLNKLAESLEKKISQSAALQADTESKGLLDSVLENIPNMVFVKEYDQGLRFKFFNKAGRMLLGLSEEQILGKNDYDFFPKDQADFFTDKDREVFKNRRVVRIPKEAISTPTGQRWLETYKIPTYKSDGSPNHLIGISIDITDELKLQESLELERSKAVHSAKLASLGEMSAGIAHEIRNPLGVIYGTIPLIKKFLGDPKKLDAKLELMTKSAERIEKIVTGLRKFSRAKEGHTHKMEDLKQIVNEAISFTESKAKRYSVVVSSQVPDELSLKCDAVEIEQVLVNLINNGIDAIKEAPEKWVRLEASERGDDVVLRVIDSGMGISLEVEQKLFHPFFTTKPVGEGTGLGLSIAKGILEQHNASLNLNHDLPNTCFEICFSKAKNAENGP